jgi:hypothetical protein
MDTGMNHTMSTFSALILAGTVIYHSTVPSVVIKEANP